MKLSQCSATLSASSVERTVQATTGRPLARYWAARPPAAVSSCRPGSRRWPRRRGPLRRPPSPGSRSRSVSAKPAASRPRGDMAAMAGEPAEGGRVEADHGAGAFVAAQELGDAGLQRAAAVLAVAGLDLHQQHGAARRPGPASGGGSGRRPARRAGAGRRARGGQVGDQAVRAGHPLQRLVVEHHRLAVGRQAHVQLDPIAGAAGDLEGGQEFSAAWPGDHRPRWARGGENRPSGRVTTAPPPRRPRPRSSAAGGRPRRPSGRGGPRPPNASTIRSEQPFTTCGMSKKLGPAWTKPPSFTTRATRSRSPVRRRLHLGDQVQAAQPRGALAGVEVEVGPHRPLDPATGVDRDLAGDCGPASGPDERHIVGHRRHWRRQHDPGVGEALFDLGHPDS